MRNVFTLIFGTGIAQAIPTLIMPILTRLYTPEQFGEFASYLAIVSIFCIVATGRLDMALMLPKKNEDSIRIIHFAMFLAVATTMCLYHLIFIIDAASSFLEITIKVFHYFIPIGVLFFAVYSLVIAWHNKNRNYKLMSCSRVIQSSSISVSQVAIGTFGKYNLGLIYSDILGRLISIVIILKGSGLLNYKIKFNKLKTIALLKRYKNFPIIEAPASLINVCSHYLPFIVLPLMISSKVAGLYFLVFRVLMIPASFVGKAVLEVFKNRIQEDFRNIGSCKVIFVRTGVMLFLISFIPTILLTLFAPTLFKLAFGEEWREAGEYARILAPLAMLQFVSSPLSYVLVFREKLFLDFKLQIIFLVLVSASLWVASIYSSTLVAVWLLTVSGMIFSSMQLYLSYRHTELHL